MSLNSPSRIFASSMLTPAAWISTSTSRSPTVGSATSPAIIGLLYLLTRYAFIGRAVRVVADDGLVGRWGGPGHSALEELEDRGDELTGGLEDPAVSGVGVDGEPGVGDAAGEVLGVAARDHDVVVAVGHEDRLGDLAEIVGRAQAGFANRLELGEPGLHRDPLVAIAGALLEAGHVLRRGALAGRVAVEEQGGAGGAGGAARA